MNISRIQKMSSEGDMSINALRYLLDCRAECEHLDYKLEINFNIDRDSCCISKDIVAMKNMGGGYIVVGVADKTWKPIGITKLILADTKMLRDKVRKYSGLDIEADLIHHTILENGTKKLFALILIRSSAKRTKLKSPSICQISFAPREEWGIRQGDIYIRYGDQTKRLDDSAKLNDFLEDLEIRYQVDEINQANNYPSPFAIETGFYRLLPKEFGDFIGREDFIDSIKNAIERDPRIWIINLHGPGGVGKSALATWIAYEYFNEKFFDAILHLSAKDIELATEDGIRYLKPSLFSLEDFLDKVLCLFEFNEFCATELDEKKEAVIDLLSTYSSLIILDNMETIRDGRIMEFIHDFPPKIKAKVLLTSRQRTSAWEFPIQVTEFSPSETRDFVSSRCEEMHLDFPQDDETINRLVIISGGLPLAIRWILGEYAQTKNLKTIMDRVVTPDSPLLEFSFRNSWDALDSQTKQALSVLSILEEAPTQNIWRTILNWPIDSIERAISKLEEFTFVTEHIDQRTGEKTYHALPITLSFARNELKNFGYLGNSARTRYQEYKNRLDLAGEEIYQCEGLFQKFEAVTDTQKKAILLCRMAEGQISSLGYDEAEEYYKQALTIDPRSVYALVSYGKFKSDQLFFEEAIQLISKALERISKLNGFYVYYNLADVYSRMKDWNNKVHYLIEALKFEPENTRTKHALGVAYGQLNHHSTAINIFEEIIEKELSRQYGPSNSLIYAVNTKIVSLRKLGQQKEIIPFLNKIISRLNDLHVNDYLKEQIASILSANT
jgi:tetratricopeptide (TPR) repeat protein